MTETGTGPDPATPPGRSGDGRAPRTGDSRARRMVDVALGTLFFLAASPLLLLGVVAVWLGCGRPIFFGHRRVGRGGRPFRCWKLRTMRADAEEVLASDPELRRRHRENGYKLPTHEDPRVTPVGRWLRRSYLDEIPQFINVLNGTMTLVGPRPVVEAELEWFHRNGHHLLEVRPGVFGAWVARGEERPDYPERAEIEMRYLADRSLSRDLRILGRSVLVVLRGEPDER